MLKYEWKRSSGSRDIKHTKSSNFIGREHFRHIKGEIRLFGHLNPLRFIKNTEFDFVSKNELKRTSASRDIKHSK